VKSDTNRVTACNCTRVMAREALAVGLCVCCAMVILYVTVTTRLVGNIFAKLQLRRSEIRSCPEIRFSKYPLPVTALASMPGSGNTWMRHLIQMSTGAGTFPPNSQGDVSVSSERIVTYSTTSVLDLVLC